MKLIDILILTNIKGLGNTRIANILNYCEANNIQTLEELQKADLSSRFSKSFIEKLESGFHNYTALHVNISKDLQSYEDNNIKCLSIVDEKYPELLKNSTNPPVVLFYKGNIELLNTRCVAVIGIRENTSIGENITKKTVDFLVENDFTIVSGLANGIDEIAHKQALLHRNGKTIAILPSIDTIYPVVNKNLAQDILDRDGLLIAEQKPYSRFHPGHLVKRDRIQSGLSKGVFVIETTLNGGSMHATNDAIKLGRSVFTPDIYKLHVNYQNIQQVEGIKSLIDTNKSISYSNDTYEKIVNKLNQPLQKDSLW